ncbi:hypothetical protein, partial [Phocaeicola vulgatus]|uniref:hypothetical protein n=1 Tax=Phocaeicola vulgatus TaxID=821 RepID=UPI001C867A7C
AIILHDIKVCLIYCPIVIKSTYLHQHFLRISTMLFSVSSHLSPKKSPPLLQLNFKFRTKLKKASLNFPSKNAEQH